MVFDGPLSLKRGRLGGSFHTVALVAIPITCLGLMTRFLPAYDTSLQIVGACGLMAALSLGGAAVALRDLSEIWAIALPSFAAFAGPVGASVVGIRLLIYCHAPFGRIGWIGTVCAAMGVVFVALYRYLDNRRQLRSGAT